MYIKSIVLDGFKSYGKKTVIDGFDPEFTAITGLNGTGKSNILDSICFVLGITNLSQVRAGSLQDLIFKSGQAGINKAVVSIIFDNSNKEQSPAGFESYNEITVTRQIVMGGKNKYLINGINVQNKRVQDMFLSVHLNVNNPHFLIMQGRITKVLNMKPPEILSMIEEAAGTRMYETKRQAAQKMIEKKDAKLKELNDIVSTEIGPKLDKLKEERSAYLEFQRIEREIEHMLRLYQAWEYNAIKRAVEDTENAIASVTNKIDEINENVSANKNLIAKIEEETTEMSKQAELDKEGKLKALESELEAKEKEATRAISKEKSISNEIASEEDRKTQLEKNLKNDKNLLKNKEAELSKVQNIFESLKENEAKDSEAFAAAQKRYEALSAGMEINDDGEAETLQEQLIHVKQEANNAKTESKQATMELSHWQTQLKSKEKEFGTNISDYNRDKSAVDKIQQEVNNLEKSLKKINFSEEQVQNLQERKQVLIEEVRTIRENTERFYAYRPHANFVYSDPEANFNKNRVNGVVCRLFKVKDPKNSLALETAAGGRLYNVVVDTDVTSKKLLQNGNLQQRTTFIPLNKIQSGKINQSVVKFAQDLVGKENVQSALDLISYDKRIQPAIEYIFGNVFVCKDLNVAKQVTFHPRIMKKSVTLDGDVVDPSGTLSGGAAQKGGSMLIQLAEIMQLEEQLKHKEQEFSTIETELKKMSSSQQQWFNVKKQLELREHEYNLCKQRLQQTSHHKQQEEIDQIKQTIAELTTKIQKCKETENKSIQKVKELENKIKNSKGTRDQQLKEAESAMNNLKQKSDKSRKEWQKREQDYECLNLEIGELRKGIETKETDIRGCDENIRELQEKYAQLKNETAEIQAVVEDLKGRFKEEKKVISEKNKGIQKKLQEKEKLASQIAEFELEIKRQNMELKKLDEDLKHTKAKEHEYAKKHKKGERNAEAEAMDERMAKELEKRIRNAQEKRTKLSRTVNAKAQSMIEHEEKQYNQLIKRIKIVEGDKKKILTLIAELDKKKKEAIMLAWQQVSKDFGSIFSTLLPGANAKLQPMEGQSVLNGLEVKVSLGGVWKDSLSELSGGQRSLVALSLILAMLLFKPAPLYILDEVDAALDLSHTQNIGNMLKTHFKQSQFIIVSLKDGMFTNANVLFKTRFIDGFSAVTRTVNRSN